MRFATSQPVRFATGELWLSALDVSAPGYGQQWGHTRSFSSRQSWSETFGNGFNWKVTQWPFAVIQRSTQIGHANEITTIIVQGQAESTLWFDAVGGNFVPRFGVKARLEHDAGNEVYRLISPDGTVTEFDHGNGAFQRRVESGGAVISVTAYLANGFSPSQVERSYTTGGVTTTDQLKYEYSNASGDQLLSTVTLLRKVGAGSWGNVQRSRYTYYGYGEANGGEEDLKTVITENWGGAAWVVTGTTYYRYYPWFLASSSSSSSGGGIAPLPVNPLNHLLKYVVEPWAYARMLADGLDPLMVSDGVLAQYADNYFEYDSSRRVTKEMVDGASRTFLLSYATSGFADGINSWKTKTVETLPDGVQNLVYSNYAGQPMLSVIKSGSDEWATFYRYDSNFRAILQAEPSAVTGYDEGVADLLNYNSGTGKFQYLRDSAGLVRNYTYHTPSGFVASSSLRQGQTGTAVKLADFTYCCAGSDCGCGSGSSSSSSSGTCASGVWMLAREVVYTSDSNPAVTQVTTSCYSYYSGTTQVQQKTTTLPIVPTNQNGSGLSVTRKEYFDSFGNLTWSMDERGFITRRVYDIPTGAMLQLVNDVDTATASGVPSGWTTPVGGGLNLVTDMTIDSQGRTTQSLGPAHSIDIGGTVTTIRRATWMVYDDGNHITYSGQGYLVPATSSNTLINPVSVTKRDAKGKVLEQIQAMAPSTSGTLASIISGAGGGAAAFPQSSYTAWTTYQYTDCCLAASMRVYHTIPTSGEGTSGTNYDETDYGYDVMKRRNRTVTPGGTITFQVYDARGLVSSTWVGTNDNGATDQDPSGGGAPGNNMVIVSGAVYDGGTDGGDGNLTQQTQYASASDTRATAFTYDFRNRQVTTDGEVDFFEKSYYDNLDRVVKSERYDTTSGGNLIGRSETKFDPRGQVYQTIRYGVDPATGTVGNSLTDNTWYDPSGNVIKSLPSGSNLFTKTFYDSLGRTTTQYVGYDTDETGYPG